MTDNLEHEAIIDEAVHGRLLRDIAGARGMTVPQIRKIIDKGAAEAFSGEQLRRELFLEAKRLRKLGQRYFDRAMTGDDASAVIFIKASERLATLTGMNAPIGHAVQVMHQVAPERQTSTESIREALDALRESKQSCDNGEDIPPQPN